MFSQRNKTMSSVRFVLLLILVGTLQIVCGDKDIDKDIEISCADVTGKVGETLILTCSISYKRSECCMKLYKFTSNDDEICRKEIPSNPCEQWTSITCSYTLKVTMTTTFKFLQTICGHKSAEFTVHVSDTETPTNAPVATDAIKDADGSQDTEGHHRSNVPVIAAVVSGFIIIIIIIIITVTVIYSKKRNCSSLPECFRSTDMRTDNSMI
ncbi:uncharacterized protein LOC127626552 isoform X5 [Xyrauchen texanus]|uniref:uncharacterized protein LOC127626552 isoform X5 n=1 Tax=Xyrauchen texanus TaxID=154827 RepID=UPI002242280F|nr:uncharacterized protein LOC127626552 isoform X5 [Xyrauchen texanus]